jgi:hypothetical protein
VSTVEPPDNDPDRLREEIDLLANQAACFAAEQPWDLGPQDVARDRKQRSVARTRGRIVTLAVAALIIVVFVAPLPQLHLFGASKPATTRPGSHATSTTLATASSTTRPTSTTTPASAAGPPLACGKLDLWTTAARSRVRIATALGKVAVALTGTTSQAPGGDAALVHPVLSLSVNGRGFSRVVTAPAMAEGKVILWGIAPQPANIKTPQKPNSDALCLARFPGGDMPIVLIGLFTGGAHCCTVVRAVQVSSAGPGSFLDDNLGNASASLGRDGDNALIITADNAFAYAFSDYADSGMPIRVLQFQREGFADVTARHPGLVASDASLWWSGFGHDRANGLGLLAAWVADECVLGQDHAAWETVDHLQAEGRLVAPAGWPEGATYLKDLKSFLTRHGYCS